MQELIEKYQKEIDFCNERLRHKLSIEDEITTKTVLLVCNRIVWDLRILQHELTAIANNLELEVNKK